MIRLEEVSYWYPGQALPAVAGVTLEVAPGEVVGLTGANECGKTTVCLLAAGLAPRVVGGRVEGRITLPAGAAMLFDAPAAQLTGLHTTVFDEVAFGPCNLGLPIAEVELRTRSALAALGIAGFAGRHPDHLSGGERQLVALAGLLAMRPSHLVLDEPLGRLDEEGSALVAAAIGALAAAGTALLVAEHRLPFLAEVATRVVAL
ncbi:MAG TPA: ABC transporter ATP-binding protein [Candidatus Dormibacteraeota bacterium]